ncbi:MAG: hypothetical protein KDJ49_07645, partial [Alphaproteobacteria bacterium]|nr:hypothetical protein [Alphaproteobacteria bacterium]
CAIVSGEFRLTETTNLYRTAPDIGPILPYPESIPQEHADHYLAQGAIPIREGFKKLACPDCVKCVPARIVLDDFKPGREHRRIVARNRDLAIQIYPGLPPLAGNEGKPALGLEANIDLHIRHMIARGYWDAPSTQNPNEQVATLSQALASFQDSAHYPGLRPHFIAAIDESERLVGGLLFFTGAAAAFGGMFYHTPERIKTSLGQAMVLESIAWLQDAGYKYLYLGDWTRVATPYSWKGNYTPLELFIHDEWTRMKNRPDIRAQRCTYGQIRPGPRTP